MGTSLRDRLPNDRIAETPFGDVYVYASGICIASVCAPADLDGNGARKTIRAATGCLSAKPTMGGRMEDEQHSPQTEA